MAIKRIKKRKKHFNPSSFCLAGRRPKRLPGRRPFPMSKKLSDNCYKRRRSSFFSLSLSAISNGLWGSSTRRGLMRGNWSLLGDLRVESNGREKEEKKKKRATGDFFPEREKRDSMFSSSSSSVRLSTRDGRRDWNEREKGADVTVI